MSNKKNDSKRKNINRTSKSPYKTEKTKICWMLGTAARDKLFNSSSFCKSMWEHENEEIRQQIKSGKLGTKEKKVIHVLKKNRKTKYRGTVQDQMDHLHTCHAAVPYAVKLIYACLLILARSGMSSNCCDVVPLLVLRFHTLCCSHQAAFHS
ncbi:hypothetical protein AVEN_3197-1 [Araneus ventricosus]|uniref:Uncharacterized protein n=1 Tax=Araneus ventricosus TaxID=182803 RepID=A0A4Y2JI73_ARAVE|nr:hypothetical protein AVEN_3197-1 [Araneus ventricosus]